MLMLGDGPQVRGTQGPLGGTCGRGRGGKVLGVHGLEAGT